MNKSRWNLYQTINFLGLLPDGFKLFVLKLWKRLMKVLNGWSDDQSWDSLSACLFSDELTNANLKFTAKGRSFSETWWIDEINAHISHAFH